MKKRVLLFLLLSMSQLHYSQKSITMTNSYGSENQEIQNLMDFEKIYTERLNFTSEDLKGKDYEVSLEEFKNGKLIKTSALFDSSDSDYFKIDSNSESLSFFFKLSDGKLKTYIRGKKFGSKKYYFELDSDSDEYTLKDFFGDKKEVTIDFQKKNAVFAIITPTIYNDGSSSYCEVAYSGIAPEKFGEHFNIPHYFIVSIKFK
ncbi:hypothetical protein BXU11_06335 [Flavobacterium sp. LM5]|uniref:hypothetical protein n=1 Tax=Flavobacterium sp. LM5 TaxID=1938610 RepID=UPI000991F53F|nr:hypothetical protein [Flavobacterium sp. LM5]OOV29498.1 hypothetical protein BXU11_06335 [Flavobacterium sp. LM5]